MSKIFDGGPAFPMQDPQAIHSYAVAAVVDVTDTAERDRQYTLARAAAVGGMSLRDYFAAKAVAGMMASRDPRTPRFNPEDDAAYVYAVADAMLKAREVQP